MCVNEREAREREARERERERGVEVCGRKTERGVCARERERREIGER